MSQQEVTAAKPPVEAKNGLLTFNSIESLHRLACYLVESRMLPKQFGNAAQAAIGVQFAIQLGFRDNWLIAMRQIAVINGNPNIFGDLPLAMVRSSGQLEEFDEYLFDAKGVRISMSNGNVNAELAGSVCRVKRKGYAAAERIFTVEDAKKAGVWQKNVWAVYPKRMIQMRARSIALKDEFADILSGVSLGEYDHNTTIEKVVECDVMDTVTGSSKLAAIAEASRAEPEIKKDIEIESGNFEAFNETVIGKEEG
jgi:hypothetical protein